uniref:Uncharacterized protein n=1 Tax=Acrobeloides nanus TaxID=290746 RepID=A0A914D664_9BILA
MAKITRNLTQDDQITSTTNEMVCVVCEQKGAAKHYGSICCDGCMAKITRNLTQDDQITSTTNEMVCVVCEQKGAAKHYGSICCDGCKGFFRRTVRFNRKFICAHGDNCNMRYENRNNCRACRLKKCLEGGLNPKLVHSDRKVPPNIRQQKQFMYKEDSPFSNYSGPNLSRITVLEDTQSTIEISEYSPQVKHEEEDHELWEVRTILSNSHHLSRNQNLSLGKMNIIPAYKDHNLRSVTKYFKQVERLCEIYVDTNLWHFCAEFENKCSVNVPQYMAVHAPRLISHRSEISWKGHFYVKDSILKRVWCRIIANTLDWLSHVPEVHGLNDQDQELLLIGRSVPSAWLVVAYKSYSTKTPGLALSGGAYFPSNKEEMDKTDPSMKMLFSNLAEIIENEFTTTAKSLKLTETEYTFLRVICFLTPVPGMTVEGTKKVNEARNKYINLFSELIHGMFPNMAMLDILNRISQIMLLIPVFEKVTELEDATMALMTLFNIAEMRGTLSYDIHCDASTILVPKVAFHYATGTNCFDRTLAQSNSFVFAFCI